MNSFIKLTFTLLTIFALGTGNAYGKGNVVFDKLVHDFGAIVEKNGNVNYTFHFTNKGTTPVVVNSITTSCGCATPTWTKDPVLPDKQGSITVTYNPLGRPGTFDKTLTVMSNGNPASIGLRIVGEVVQIIPSIEEQYPVMVGSALRLKSKTIQLPRAEKSATVTNILSVYNNGDEPLSISFSKVPSHIELAVEPATIPAKQRGTVTCLYNAAKKDDWGPVSDVVSVKVVSGKRTSKSELTISAVIIDDIKDMPPAQRAKAGFPQFKSTVYKLDNVTKGALVNATFVLTNAGQTSLTVRKISAQDKAISTSVTKNTVRPGESVVVSALLDTNEVEAGKVSFPVEVYTNSPRSPQTTLYISGNIVK